MEDNCSVKLLGVTFDQHLRFSQHVDSIIGKCRPAFHSICKLRKAGVNDSSLTLFYKARIIPLIYAAPCWYPLLGKTDKERHEKYQRHCLRLIYPNLENSASRLDTAGLATVSVQKTNAIGTLHDYIHTGDASHLEAVALYQLVHEQHLVARTCSGIINFTPT